MDALSMPLLMDWQKAEDAFAILRSSKRSAVVVRDNLAKYWLAWASDIDDARRTPVAALASIKNRDPIYAAQMTDHKQYGIDFVHPGTTADQMRPGTVW